ncbi:protein of unknown function [Enterobacter cancerogenus]|nr:protein of unknown function [Enterobacter cancerogenus]
MPQAPGLFFACYAEKPVQHTLPRYAHHRGDINLNFPYLVWLKLITTTSSIPFSKIHTT